MEQREIPASGYVPSGIHKVLWDYWCEMQQQGGGLIAPYALFRPSRLSSILPQLALSEYIDENTQKIRVIGGGHDGLWPPEAIGSNLFDHVDPVTAEVRKKLYHEVISRPCGCYFDEVAVSKTGKRVRYKGLFLPLLDKAGAPNIFIGAYDISAEGYDLEDASEEGIITRDTHDVILINLRD